MIPKKKQWQQWSLPSKYTAIGLLVAVFGIVFSLFQIMGNQSNDELIAEVKAEIKNTYKDIQATEDSEKEYVDRYLKRQIADILDAKIYLSENRPRVRLYYESYWEGLTSSFSASLEVRRIDDLNKGYVHDEGWKEASLLQEGNSNDNTFYLGESKFVTIVGLKNGEVYEVRIVDHSYNSDEPPSYPHRFRVVKKLANKHIKHDGARKARASYIKR